jgi:hypothetical protein
LPLPEAADPLRPSAERAKPNVVTSDALCRKAVPERTLLLVHTRRERPDLRRFVLLPCQDPIPHRRVRAVGLVGPGRLPSDGCPTLLPGRATSRSLFKAGVRSPSTFVARSAPAPLSRGAADPCYPSRSTSPLRAPATTRGRCLSPTSATDQQHEHPQNRLIPKLLPSCDVLRQGRRSV